MCIGVMAAEALRCIGLQAILEDSLHWPTVVLGDGPLPKGCRPQLVILDAGAAPEEQMTATVERLRRLLPWAPVVVLAEQASAAAQESAVAAGARGFLPATAEVQDIRTCVQTVLGGAVWLPMQGGSGPEPVGEAEALSERLTPKEREVLRWLTQGRSNREIASTMQIDEATVKAHLGRMLRKAKVSNRVELTLRALGEPI